METIFDTLVTEILILIVLGAVGGFATWLKKIKSTQDNACKRLWRLEKAFTLFVKMELNQTKRDHPETDTEEIETVIDEILSED